jgi:two-component system NtrC family sensor kinase
MEVEGDSMKEKDILPSHTGLLREQTEKLFDAFLDRYRFSTLGSLVKGIIHNFNGSIQILSMQMELLQGMLASGKEEIKPSILVKMEQSLEQIDRMKTMIEILNKKGARDDNLTPQDIYLNELLEEELSLLQHHLYFKHQVKVKKSLYPQLPPLKGIYNDFSEGLLSLVHNAIEAMKETPQKELTLMTQVEDHHVQLSIRDTGCGISEEIRPHLFQPFFTTKGEDHFGLGLFVSRELLTPYGASFNYTSREGETIFSINFPIQAVHSRSLRGKSK